VVPPGNRDHTSLLAGNYVVPSRSATGALFDVRRATLAQATARSDQTAISRRLLRGLPSSSSSAGLHARVARAPTTPTDYTHRPDEDPRRSPLLVHPGDGRFSLATKGSTRPSAYQLHGALPCDVAITQPWTQVRVHVNMPAAHLKRCDDMRAARRLLTASRFTRLTAHDQEHHACTPHASRLTPHYSRLATHD